MKYIDAEKLIAEINNRLMSVNLEELGNFGCHRVWAYNDVKDLITSLQQEKPEYGHFVSYFISGKKSIFNVGDILAYYICTSNEEGEGNIGKIEKVVFDEEENGWIYTFENGDVYSEEELVSNDFYKKN